MNMVTIYRMCEQGGNIECEQGGNIKGGNIKCVNRWQYRVCKYVTRYTMAHIFKIELLAPRGRVSSQL